MTGDDCHRATGESGHRHWGEKVQRCWRTGEVRGERRLPHFFVSIRMSTYRHTSRKLSACPKPVYHRKEA